MLTIEKKAKFESQCTEARFHCSKVFDIIQERKEELTALYKFYNKWREAFKVADRKLANEKVQVVPVGARGGKEVSDGKLITSLSKEEILKVIDRLQVEIGKGGEIR